MEISSAGYKVYVGSDSFKKLNAFLKKGNYSQYFILGDENTIKHCLPLLVTSCKALAKAEIFEVESGEVSKGLSICSQLWQALIEYKADRQALIINLGGGVICDLGGFLASVYKRGIHFINVPTSLLAMADASVGGKNGINLEGVKNAIGTITQPAAVFVSPDFLDTLPYEHVQNGMAEIYKIALISDKTLWKQLNSSKPRPFEDVIARSISLKNNIVLKDPYEKNIRKALNFGHTIGHTLESASFGEPDELLHGEAVVMGMLCESYIAHRKKLLPEKDMTEIVQVMKTTFSPRKISKKEFDKAGEYILNDKKNKKGKVLLALVNGIGKYKIDVNVSADIIAASLNFYNSIVDD